MANGIGRFTSLRNLESVRRPKWKELHDKHRTELEASGAKWPDESSVDETYYANLRTMFLSPKEIPDELGDFLCMVADMANDTGESRLRKAMAKEQRCLPLPDDFSTWEIVIEIGLAFPELLRTQHLEHQLFAVTSFHYFGTKTSEENRLPFKLPPPEARAALEKALDAEFAARQRGRKMVTVTPYELEGELWCVIDRGGTMKREVTREDDGKRGVVNFRPGIPDLIVFNAARDQIRIHAEADWQREIYRTEFGKYLRGHYDYFNVKRHFTLGALLGDVEEVLSTQNFPQMGKVGLVEIAISLGGDFDDVIIVRSKDRVASVAQQNAKTGKTVPVVPASGRLVWAILELHNQDPKKKPRRLRVALPNVLRMPKFSDARQLLEWLEDRGFLEIAGHIPASAPRLTVPAGSVPMPSAPPLPAPRAGTAN
jgi:hypothetical protein